MCVACNCLYCSSNCFTFWRFSQSVSPLISWTWRFSSSTAFNCSTTARWSAYALVNSFSIANSLFSPSPALIRAIIASLFIDSLPVFLSYLRFKPSILWLRLSIFFLSKIFCAPERFSAFAKLITSCASFSFSCPLALISFKLLLCCSLFSDTLFVSSSVAVFRFLISSSAFLKSSVLRWSSKAIRAVPSAVTPTTVQPTGPIKANTAVFIPIIAVVIAVKPVTIPLRIACNAVQPNIATKDRITASSATFRGGHISNSFLNPFTMNAIGAPALLIAVLIAVNAPFIVCLSPSICWSMFFPVTCFVKSSNACIMLPSPLTVAFDRFLSEVPSPRVLSFASSANPPAPLLSSINFLPKSLNVIFPSRNAL